jgi:alginate O-acetyltransferase complex protein AlgI
MNYNDPAFLILLSITFVLYYLIPIAQWQISVLVISSLIFYAWEAPQLLTVFVASWLITASCSWLVMHRVSHKLLWATIGVVLNLAMLGFFKYKSFFADQQNAAPYSVGIAGWLLLAPLPIGISFYTFHGISMLVDLYRGREGRPVYAENFLHRHLVKTLLYLVFFPQLIAGPIVKAKDFFPQVKTKSLKDIDYSSTARIIILGTFLKSVVADNLSEQTFWLTYPWFLGRSSLDLIVLLYGYSFQIFADFAGYSLIAIGLAKLFGYCLPDNFNFPYLASSLGEFWRRWHISLSSWLRDYLYIPLGGNQKGSIRTYINLIIVMFLGGLWHGAAWSFAFWGLWHGVGLALERGFRKSTFLTSTNQWIITLRIFLVFNFVTLGWLLFKLQEFDHVSIYIRGLFTGSLTSIRRDDAWVICIYSFFVVLYHLQKKVKGRLNQFLIDIGYGLMLVLIILNSGPSTPFIYFQF